MSMPRTDPLWRWSARQLLDAIGKREVSCREMVQAHLERASEIYSTLNSATYMIEKEALEMASAADRIALSRRALLRGRGNPRGVARRPDADRSTGLRW